MDTPAGYAELMDGVASAVHWVDSRPGTKVAPYDENSNLGFPQGPFNDTFWTTSRANGS